MNDIKEELKNYKYYKTKIRCLECDLEIIDATVTDEKQKLSSIEIINNKINSYKKLVERIECLLSNLEPTERKVVELIYFQRKKNKEIVSTVFKLNNVSESTKLQFISQYRGHVINKLEEINKLI